MSIDHLPRQVNRLVLHTIFQEIADAPQIAEVVVKVWLDKVVTRLFVG